VPTIRYPAGLPVVDRRVDIAAAISQHQVVIVAGETGSGKTTQLPKICLELGRGVNGVIGHTQPRRIAARAVAERIAEELHTPLGEAIGYKVRFTDRANDNTLVKVMTDGILLAELQHDKMLRRYDTIIIDEAHERSLNIDFILGYLKRLLPRRPDLKVIVTSATIDPQRFSEHFGGAPIIEVSGRMFPVEVRYRPLLDESDPSDDENSAGEANLEAEPRDQITAICEAVDELCREGPGDILVFLSGEREIRDTSDALRKRDVRGAEVVPLFARLSSAEQHRVFAAHTGRRIVLATNVAETSLTVPGIRYVVDPGTARISRYSHRTKVQRLPIEPISQASANQRKGRCGRVEAGICIRLYSENDYLSRPEFTEPEILRTNLASVILQMAALGLGDIAGFPFVEPPDRRNIRDGVTLLEELGAIEGPSSKPKLTPIGRNLAALPVDPRIGRMVLQADEFGCARDVIVIAAALSIIDPRERPVEKQQAADELHARFADPESDFIGYLNLWEYLRAKQHELSSNRFRRLCKAEFLNYLRVREWQDVASQLRQVARTLGVRGVEGQDSGERDVDRQGVHRSLLAGLLSHIGVRDVETRDYLGARSAHFGIFPGSALFKKQPRWVMAAELVETTRLWGRVCARIEPEWVEPLAAHLVKRSYSEPHWDSERGAVMAYEKVLLYGIPIVSSRRLGYSRIDPALARELFIRHALVEGDWRTHHAFFRANQATIEQIAQLEARVRRRDLVVDDETLFDLYNERVDASAASARHFDSWWKKAKRTNPDLLTFGAQMLMAKDIDISGLPDIWVHGQLSFPVTYVFSPGADDDGVTVHIPVAVLNQVSAADFTWQVPGRREELIVALVRSLPKALRRHFVPVPDTAKQLVGSLGVAADPLHETLYEALSRHLWRRAAIEVRADDFDLTQVPERLRIRFNVVGDNGESLGSGRDLEELSTRLVGSVRRVISQAAADVQVDSQRAWSFGSLPTTVDYRRAGMRVVGFPALIDQGDAVGVRVLESASEAVVSSRLGLRRLLLLNVPSPARALQRQLSNQTKLALSRNAPGSVTELLDDCLACAVDAIVQAGGGVPRDEAGFDVLLARARVELSPLLARIVITVVDVLAAAHDVEKVLKAAVSPAALPALVDMKNQLGSLVYKGFVSDTGADRLPDLLRYVQAVGRRLERLPEDVDRDRARMWEVEQAQAALDDVHRRGGDPQVLDEVRWMIEELRVSLFAQILGTPKSVSLQRILRALAEA